MVMECWSLPIITCFVLPKKNESEVTEERLVTEAVDMIAVAKGTEGEDGLVWYDLEGCWIDNGAIKQKEVEVDSISK